MRSDWIISGVGHAVLLFAGLITIAGSKQVADASIFVPVAIVNSADMSLTPLGQMNAPKGDTPKPLADKVGDPKPVKQLAPKVADKPEITTETAAKPEPKPEPKPPEKHEKKPAEFKPDKIADLLKKDEAKKPPKPEQPPPPEKPAHQTPAFDASQVAALLDKREPQRQMAAAETINNTPTLGAADAPQAAQLSQSEIDALRNRIRDCWNPPAGVDGNSNIYVKLRVLFKPDGSLAYAPVVVEGSASSLGPAFAESAKRALLVCQPFTMLKPEHYDMWKDIEFTFTPREMLGG